MNHIDDISAAPVTLLLWRCYNGEIGIAAAVSPALPALFVLHPSRLLRAPIPFAALEFGGTGLAGVGANDLCSLCGRDDRDCRNQARQNQFVHVRIPDAGCRTAPHPIQRLCIRVAVATLNDAVMFRKGMSYMNGVVARSV